jgi:hypothetical protein
MKTTDTNAEQIGLLMSGISNTSNSTEMSLNQAHA